MVWGRREARGWRARPRVEGGRGWEGRGWEERGREWASRMGSTTSRSTWRERAAVFPFRADRAESEELPRAAHLSTDHGEGVEVSGLKT